MLRNIPRSAGLALVACATIALAGTPAAAVDPVFDPLRPDMGPTISKPSSGARAILREAERAPTLTARFGLPSVSGPLPLVPNGYQPVFDTPANAWPPAVTRSVRE